MAARRRPGDLLIALTGAVIAVAAVLPTITRWLTNPPDQRLVDLDVYRSGGAAVLRGAPLYDVLTQPPQLLPFTYPPFAGVLAAPLALVPWPVIQWLWTIALYAALGLAVWLAFGDLIRRAGRWAPIAAGTLFALVAHMMPVSDQIRFGQVGLFLLVLCAADCLLPNTRWPRGVLVGLATAIKLVPGVFLIYFLLTGRRDAAWNAVLTAAVVSLGTFALLPRDSFDFWFGALLDGDRVGANNGTTNQSLNGMLLRLYWPDSLTKVIWLGCVAALAYVGFRAARNSRVLADRLTGPDSRSALLAGVAITGLLSVLLSPIGWIHHLVWLILALGALVGDGRDVRRCVAALVVWVMYVIPLPWYGTRLIGAEHALIERFFGRIVQSSYGLTAVALVFVLGFWLLHRLATRTRNPMSSRARSDLGSLHP